MTGDLMRKSFKVRYIKFISVFVFAFIISAFLPFFTGTVYGKDKPALKEDLLIWTHCQDEELAVIRKQAEKFGKENNIKTLVMNLPFYKFKKTFRMSAELGKGPDMIICPNDWIGDLAEEGIITPLTDEELTVDQRKSYNQPGLMAMSYKGKIYGLPHLLETVAVIYNKKLLDKEPATMNELLEMASSFNNKHHGKYGFFFDVTNFYFSWPFMSGYGAKIFARVDGKQDPRKLTLDSPETLEGIKYLISFRTKYGLIPDNPTTDRMSNIFLKGKMLFCLNGPWMLLDLRKNKVEYGVLPLPPLPNGERPHPFVGVWGSLLNKSCKNRKMAVSFMNYLNKPENQKELCLAARRIPAGKETLNLIKDEKDILGFAQAASYGVPLSTLPAMGQVWDPMLTVLKSVVLEGKKPEITLTQQVKLIEENIKMMTQK